MKFVRFALVLLCAVLGNAQSKPPAGLWNGAIVTPAGDVAFGIDITSTPGGLTAALLNATDRQPFTTAAWDGHTLTLRLEHYDGTLTAHPASPDRMEGEYSRMTRKGVVRIPVVLTAAGPSSPLEWSGPNLSGDWLLHESQAKGPDANTPLALKQTGGSSITGILEPVSGDSGLLHGTLTAQGSSAHLHLSRFDGIHVMALDGDLKADGTLRGKFAYSTSNSDTFSARRAEQGDAADPNSLAATLTRVRDPREPFRFSGLASSGATLTQDSPEFKGKPVIVDIFGTWCPNCIDEAPVLEDLYRRYRNQGLVVVGLSYEYTSDTARDLRQIAIYREKYGVTFPLLLAGTTDEGQLEKTLPQLVDFGAFPTTIFLGRDGLVKAIHAGFEGPATGDKFPEAKSMLEENTRAIVSGTP